MMGGIEMAEPREGQKPKRQPEPMPGGDRESQQPDPQRRQPDPQERPRAPRENESQR
jgi:hypothetical protein